MKKLSTLNSQLSTQRGFTLIELLVVFGVIGILSIAGIASFVSYSDSQKVNTAALEFANFLSTAKSKALSQAKPNIGSCSSSLDNPLQKFQIKITSSSSYELDAFCWSTVVCGGSSGLETLLTKDLPSGVTFAEPIPSPICFNVLSGGLENPGIVTITDEKTTKTVTVTPDGRIIVN